MANNPNQELELELFVDPPDEEYKCGKCLCILTDPQQLRDCQHMFCKKCITKHFQSVPALTRSIPVPTSEHVAQIVGKSGSKIKYLRAVTQTCIKTPLRGDDPVFTVSGTEDNVERVVDAIQQASDHFTRIMESRSTARAVGEVTVLVSVPQQYVGVVVGRNGSVIMRIKEQTRTRINTPKGDSITPAFEVTGSQINVMAAKEAIEDKVRQALMLNLLLMIRTSVRKASF